MPADYEPIAKKETSRQDDVVELDASLRDLLFDLGEVMLRIATDSRRLRELLAVGQILQGLVGDLLGFLWGAAFMS